MTISTAKIIFHDPENLFEENMPQNTAHTKLLHYLVPLLEWLYRDKNWFVVSDLLVQKLVENEQTHEIEEHYIAPDIAVYKDVQLPLPATIESWKLSEPNRPMFSVAFEIASRSTWHDDLGDKISDYAFFRAKEYFAYDPNEPPFWGRQSRIRGWKYVDGVAQEIRPNAQGWLKSEELQSWLVPDGALLQLYDLQGNRRLTKDEVEAQQKDDALRQLGQIQSKVADALNQLKQVQAEVIDEKKAREDLEHKLNEALQKLRDAGLA